jgi:hypothetical protein
MARGARGKVRSGSDGAGAPRASRSTRGRAHKSTSVPPAKAPGAGRGGGLQASYDRFKEFGGKRYTGMQVGRRHKWRYDPGEWTEKKVTPDKWEFAYSVVKRRAGKAPEGSGAPVGTAYHWYILADQTVTKLDANSYTTEMAGLKYKLAHRRADKQSWSASERAQRKRLIQILREMISELEKSPEAPTENATRTTAEKGAPAPLRTAPPDGTGNGTNGHRSATTRSHRAADAAGKKNGPSRSSPSKRARGRKASPKAAAHA